MDYNKQILLHKMLLSNSTLRFTQGMFQYINNTPYVVGAHHRLICEALDQVVKGKIRKLMINIAPRYGKTELCSRQFIAYGFALNPNSSFLHLSYSGGLTQDNSMAVKDIVKCEYFQALYEARVHPKYDSRAKWATVQGGQLYATSTLGQITGFGAGRTDKLETEEDKEKIVDEFFERFNPDGFAGAIVIDDPIKPEDALSDNIRETVNRRFETTIRNRVNSRKTPIVIIMQRLHEHDLCGYLQEVEPDEWTVLTIPVISYNEQGEEKALWDFKHNLEELHKLRDVNSFVFETQYMQNPTPFEGLMYEHLRTYDTAPIYYKKPIKKCYTDSADTGSDWLCSICYDEYDFGMYITDVLYTKKPMEYTENELPRMLMRNKTEVAIIEGNNGGRSFARTVEKNVRTLGDTKMRFEVFTQSENKQVRIFTHSAEVQNMIFFPADWERRWAQFSNDIKGYRKEGRNAHDDAPDVLTGMIEHRTTSRTITADEVIASFE